MLIENCVKCSGTLLANNNEMNCTLLYCKDCNIVYYTEPGDYDEINFSGTDVFGMPITPVKDQVKFKCCRFLGFTPYCCLEKMGYTENEEDDEETKYKHRHVYCETPYCKMVDTVYYFDLNKAPCGLFGCYCGAVFSFWETSDGETIIEAFN
jgi:hypothetical protein